MKAQTTTKQVTTNGIQNSVSFGIKEGGFAHIFNVLRNQLYSNKYQAVLREYATNAVDAHVEADIEDRPIEVTLPNPMSLELKIRDFGPALTDKEIQDIYAFYGESTKRNTNKQTGMLGIGSKSAFAYGDNFVINSYYGGKKHVYNAYIDPSQVGQIAKLGEENTDEENGIEIVIPVKENDCDTFKDTAEEIFQHFKVRPIIHGGHQLDFDDRDTLFEGKDWKWRKNKEGYNGYYNHHKGDGIAVMGNIGYPMDFDSLNYSGEDYAELQSLCSSNLILQINIGDLEISASREKLQYTDHTINSIIKKLKSVKKDLLNEIKKQFADCDSLFSAKCLYGEIDNMASGLYEFRELISKNIKVKGHNVKTDNFYLGKVELEEVEAKKLKKPSSGRGFRLRLEPVGSIVCNAKTVIVDNDKLESRGILNRVLALHMEQGKEVYVVNFRKNGLSKLKKETGFDAPMLKLSELPKRKLNEFEGYGSSQGTGEYAAKDPKSYSKVFKLDWETIGNWHDKASDRWEKHSVDFDKDSGVYLLIDRFQPHVEGCESVSTYNRISDLRSWRLVKNAAKLMGFDLPEIVGVKLAARNKVEDKENWVDAHTWLKQKVTQWIESSNIEQHIANRIELSDSQPNDHIFRFNSDESEQLVELLVDDNSPVKKMYQAANEMRHALPKAAKDGALDELCEFIGVNLSEETVEPTYNLKKMLDKVYERYEMLTLLESVNRSWRRPENQVEKMANYINVIDVCNANNSSK